MKIKKSTFEKIVKEEVKRILLEVEEPAEKKKRKASPFSRSIASKKLKAHIFGRLSHSQLSGNKPVSGLKISLFQIIGSPGYTGINEEVPFEDIKSGARELSADELRMIAWLATDENGKYKTENKLPTGRYALTSDEEKLNPIKSFFEIPRDQNKDINLSFGLKFNEDWLETNNFKIANGELKKIEPVVPAQEPGESPESPIVAPEEVEPEEIGVKPLHVYSFEELIQLVENRKSELLSTVYKDFFSSLRNENFLGTHKDASSKDKSEDSFVNWVFLRLVFNLQEPAIDIGVSSYEWDMIKQEKENYASMEQLTEFAGDLVFDKAGLSYDKFGIPLPQARGEISPADLRKKQYETFSLINIILNLDIPVETEEEGELPLMDPVRDDFRFGVKDSAGGRCDGSCVPALKIRWQDNNKDNVPDRGWGELYYGGRDPLNIRSEAKYDLNEITNKFFGKSFVNYWRDNLEDITRSVKIKRKNGDIIDRKVKKLNKGDIVISAPHWWPFHIGFTYDEYIKNLNNSETEHEYEVVLFYDSEAELAISEDIAKRFGIKLNYERRVMTPLIKSILAKRIAYFGTGGDDDSAGAYRERSLKSLVGIFDAAEQMPLGGLSDGGKNYVLLARKRILSQLNQASKTSTENFLRDANGNPIYRNFVPNPGGGERIYSISGGRPDPEVNRLNGRSELYPISWSNEHVRAVGIEVGIRKGDKIIKEKLNFGVAIKIPKGSLKNKKVEFLSKAEKIFAERLGVKTNQNYSYNLDTGKSNFTGVAIYGEVDRSFKIPENFAGGIKGPPRGTDIRRLSEKIQNLFKLSSPYKGQKTLYLIKDLNSIPREGDTKISLLPVGDEPESIPITMKSIVEEGVLDDRIEKANEFKERFDSLYSEEMRARSPYYEHRMEKIFGDISEFEQNVSDLYEGEAGTTDDEESALPVEDEVPTFDDLDRVPGDLREFYVNTPEGKEHWIWNEKTADWVITGGDDDEDDDSNESEEVEDEQPSIEVPYNFIKQKLNINENEWNAYREAIAQKESGGNYDCQGGGAAGGRCGDSGPYDGRYQMGKDAKTDGAREAGIPDPGHEDDAREAFRRDPELQEKLFVGFTIANSKYLSNVETYKQSDRLEKLKILAHAHNQGHVATKNWLKTGVDSEDALGTLGKEFYDVVDSALWDLEPEEEASTEEKITEAKVLIFGHSQAGTNKIGGAVRSALREAGIQSTLDAAGGLNDDRLASKIKKYKGPPHADSFTHAVLFLDGNDFNPPPRASGDDPPEARRQESKDDIIIHVLDVLEVKEKNLWLVVPPMNTEFTEYPKPPRAEGQKYAGGRMYRHRIQGHKQAIDFFKRSYSDANIPELIKAKDSSFLDGLHMKKSAPESTKLANEITNKISNSIEKIEESKFSISDIMNLINEVARI